MPDSRPPIPAPENPFQNPYSPTAGPLTLSAAAPHASRCRLVVLFCIPGCIAGLLFGSVVLDGVTQTIHKTTQDPITAMKFFFALGCVSLTLTVLWRLPRRYIFGKHDLRCLGSFLGGVILVAGPYITVGMLERCGLLPASVSPRVAWPLLAVLFCFFVVLSVEVEAVYGRVARDYSRGERAHAQEDMSGRPGDDRA